MLVNWLIKTPREGGLKVKTLVSRAKMGRRRMSGLIMFINNKFA
jgi:hypothetical protein